MRKYTFCLLTMSLLSVLVACGSASSATRPVAEDTPTLTEVRPTPVPPTATSLQQGEQPPAQPVATPTSTSGLSIIGEQGGAAREVVVAFFQAVLAGNVEEALGYWNLERPDQPAEHVEFIRQMVDRWAAGGHRFTVGGTTYGGLVAPQDYQPLDEDDPRVTGALVKVRIDDVQGVFDLEKTDGHWQICGWIVVDDSLGGSVGAGLVYLKDRVVYGPGERGARPIGTLSDDAAYLTLGPRELAYVSRNEIQTFSLADGTTRVLLEFPARAGHDFNLRWSNDGSALAYAVAWDEPDGSRVVELGTHDGSQHTVVGVLIARPAGPTPTLQSEPPVSPEPGYANLAILNFDLSAGCLAVTQVGGQERYYAMWVFDPQTGQRIDGMPVAPSVPDVQEIALSPDTRRLALALAGVLQVWPLGTDAPPERVELPMETHATWLSWSPDGRYLAYLLSEGVAPGLDASPALALEVWETQTGQARRLVSTLDTYATLHGWTANSRAVVLETMDDTGQATVSLVDVVTGQSTPIPLPEGSRVVGWASNSPSSRSEGSATPRPGWQTYASQDFQIILQYPAAWQPVPGYDERYGGADGFFQVSTVGAGQGMTLDEVCALDAYHKLQPYGSQPQVEELEIQGQPACLILPSADQPAAMSGQAGLIVRYPQPVEIRSVTYGYFILWADKDHIREIAETLRFTVE